MTRPAFAEALRDWMIAQDPNCLDLMRSLDDADVILGLSVCPRCKAPRASQEVADSVIAKASTVEEAFAAVQEIWAAHKCGLIDRALVAARIR